MLKLARRARGHFVTLIEIRVHLIRVKPGHISCFELTFSLTVAVIDLKVPNVRKRDLRDLRFCYLY